MYKYSVTVGSTTYAEAWAPTPLRMFQVEADPVSLVCHVTVHSEDAGGNLVPVLYTLIPGAKEPDVNVRVASVSDGVASE